MGRKKITIKRLESAKARQMKYSKRKKGIIKKAKEISVLCDVDLTLCMFSPGGKPSLYVGQDKDLHSVIERLSQMSMEDREERRDYTKKTLRKKYNLTDDDAINFSIDNSDAHALKLKQEHIKELKEKLAYKTKILDQWKYPHTIDDPAKIRIMENHLVTALNDIKVKKGELFIQELHQDQQNGFAFEENQNLHV